MRFINKVLIGLLLLSSITACNEEDFIGNPIEVAPADFEVTTPLKVSKASLSFNTDVLELECKFNAEVTTNVIITGLESGAEYKYVLSNTDEINSSNFSWKGQHSGLYFFKSGEKAQVKIEFYGASDALQLDTVTIVKSQSFKDEFHYPLAGGDFEDRGDGSEIISYPYWIVYGKGEYLAVSGLSSEEIMQVQGVNSFRMASDALTPGYQGGMDNETAIIEGTDADPIFPPFPANADSVYFNIYLYGYGEGADKIVIEFKEADGVNETNKNGRDDGVQIIQTLEHEGWELFSYRYSQLPFSTYAPGGGSGNKTHEPHRIFRVAFSLEVTESAPRYGEATYDFPIFTIGKPFDPANY
jgi:hypothetical protein